MCEPMPLRMTKGATEILDAVAEWNRMAVRAGDYAAAAEPPAYSMHAGDTAKPVYAGR